MAYYKADRIERKNRRKAILITAFIYLGVTAFFMLKDDVNWKDYWPLNQEVASQQDAQTKEAVATTDRPVP